MDNTLFNIIIIGLALIVGVGTFLGSFWLSHRISTGKFPLRD